MKKYLSVLVLSFIVSFAFAGCYSKNPYKPTSTVIKAFNAKYPKATRVEWEQKNNYQVAEFRQSGCETKAWFDNSGTWTMTESNTPFTGLPDAIIAAFNSSNYATWKKEDIDKIERAGVATVFVIEVEKGEQEIDLYYSEEGALIKTVTDAENAQSGYQPMPQSIKNAIMQKYPAARLIDVNLEKDKWEIDILDNGVQKEITFDNANNWISTSRDIRKAAIQTEIPAVVINTLKATYKQKIDDITYIETPTGNYYLFELDHEPNDIYVKIDPTGKTVQ